MKKFVTKHEMYKETRWGSFICNVSGCKFLGSVTAEISANRLDGKASISSTNDKKGAPKFKLRIMYSRCNKFSRWKSSQYKTGNGVKIQLVQ